MCTRLNGHREKIEAALMTWFKQARPLNIPLSGLILCEKATEIAKDFDIIYVPHSGCSQRFKDRNGIICKIVCGEAASVCDETVKQWKEKTLPLLLRDYNLNDIFNADEIGLFYNCIPNKTLSL
jgi:hypothetical protein